MFVYGVYLLKEVVGGGKNDEKLPKEHRAKNDCSKFLISQKFSTVSKCLKIFLTPHQSYLKTCNQLECGAFVVIKDPYIIFRHSADSIYITSLPATCVVMGDNFASFRRISGVNFTNFPSFHP